MDPARVPVSYLWLENGVLWVARPRSCACPDPRTKTVRDGAPEEKSWGQLLREGEEDGKGAWEAKRSGLHLLTNDVGPGV